MKARATGDLTTIAFFFLLRVGEYTYSGKKQKTRTKQFRTRDITFWRDGHVLPNSAPLSTLLQATSATMCISNQKNGTRGQLIHHEATKGHLACPVQALARRVHHILQHTKNPDMEISAYFPTPSQQAKHIMSSDINAQVKQAVRSLGLAGSGFHPTLVSSHSLRAGGAMAMKLNGIDRDTIRKFGRWSSDTFLMYIHEQIGAFSKHVSTKMATAIPFHNIRGPTLLAAAA